MASSRDWQKESDGNYKNKICEVTGQGDEAQSPVDLPAEVRPVLAAMGVMQYSDGKIQLCEPSLQQEKQTPAGIMAVISEMGDTFIPDVTCEDASASQELKNGPDVSPDQTPKEEMTTGDAEEGQICKVSVNGKSTEPDVAKGDASAHQKMTETIQEETVQNVVSQEDTSAHSKGNACNIEEEVQTLSVDLLPLKGAEETSADNEETQAVPSLEMLPSNDWDISPEHQQLLDVTQGATSQMWELEPRVDLQSLPAEVRPLLAAMGVIQYSNDKIQLCEPTLQQEKETPAGITEVTSEMGDTFIPDVTCEDADVSLDQTPKEEDQTLSVGLLPLKGPEGTSFDNEENQAETPLEMLLSNDWDISPELQQLPDVTQGATSSMGVIDENNGIVEMTSAVRKTGVCNMSSAELAIRPEALFLIPALVQKVFKMAGSDNYRGRTLIIIKLQRKIKEQLIVDGQRKFWMKDFKEIGKKAAKRLIMEYGSANTVLRALQEPDNAELEAAIVNHLNIELRAFQNRPKSALARRFSSVRRALTFR